MRIPAKLAGFLAKVCDIDETSEKYGSMKYEIEVRCRELWKTALLIWMSIVFSIWQELMGFFVVYCVLRKFSGGLHLKNEFYCTLFGVSINLGFSYLSRVAAMPLWACLTIYFCVFILLYLFAPAGTKYRPVGKSKIHRLKTISLLLLTAFYLIAITSGEGLIRNSVVFGSIAQAINILPVTYRIFGEGRPKDYEKSD